MPDYEYFRLLEADLESILAELRGVLTATEEAAVREFIDAGEYGLAFETLCFVMHDASYVMPRTAYPKFLDLAKRMDIKQSYWEPIKTV
jgi:hypothetical protein